MVRENVTLAVHEVSLASSPKAKAQISDNSGRATPSERVAAGQRDRLSLALLIIDVDTSRASTMVRVTRQAMTAW
jgi:hypothetical protein